MLLLAVALISLSAWIVLLCYFQLAGITLVLAIACIVITVIYAFYFGRRRLYLGWGLFLFLLLMAMGYWFSLKPELDREWAEDVSKGVTAEIGERNVTVHNIRNFKWINKTKAEQHWFSSIYSLDDIQTVDLATSVWFSKAIAHVLVSFGFGDGRHLVFSAEIRREADETFSAIAGFFRKYELVLIAATEADILKLRTNYRQEQVALYPLNLTQQQKRSLLIAYLRLGNRLAVKPAWYNSLTTNCTTVIFQLARLVDSDIPLDWRIIASGYLPGYLYDLGIVKTNLPEDLMLSRSAITRKARALSGHVSYSDGIRTGWPEIWYDK